MSSIKMEKQIVALLLARGAISKSFTSYTSVKYKALLPINGNPMVDYVLRALYESDVEKIFIVQAYDEALEEVVAKNTKNVFLTCHRDPLSYASTVIFGLEKIIDYYGLDQIHRTTIMAVPCDIPLVGKENFNSLVEANGQKEADFVVPIVNIQHLEETYPERHFHGVYLNDLNGKYVLQNTAFFNGSALTLKDFEDETTGRLAFSGFDDDVLRGLGRVADRLNRHKEKVYQVPHIVYEFLRILAKRKHLVYGLKFIHNLYSGKMTLEQIRYSFHIILGAKCDVIESKEAELSIDIDLPEHFEWVSSNGWVPDMAEQEATTTAQAP